MQEVIIGYQGEMSLKGLNRNQFESALMKILRFRLKDAGKFNVWCAQSTFYMEPEEDGADLDLALDPARWPQGQYVRPSAGPFYQNFVASLTHWEIGRAHV